MEVVGAVERSLLWEAKQWRARPRVRCDRPDPHVPQTIIDRHLIKVHVFSYVHGTKRSPRLRKQRLAHHQGNERAPRDLQERTDRIWSECLRTDQESWVAARFVPPAGQDMSDIRLANGARTPAWPLSHTTNKIYTLECDTKKKRTHNLATGRHPHSATLRPACSAAAQPGGQRHTACTMMVRLRSCVPLSWSSAFLACSAVSNVAKPKPREAFVCGSTVRLTLINYVHGSKEEGYASITGTTAMAAS